MLCAVPPPIEGSQWADLAECLDERGLHETAAVAWRRAWDADRATADRALPAAVAFAHRSGDDRLVVDIASSLPEPGDPEVAGHVALAAAVRGDDDERSWLEAVPRESCRYPYARQRLATLFAEEGKRKSEVYALREVVETRIDVALERGLQWQVGFVRSVALLRVASVYADLERAANVRTYAEIVAAGRDALAPDGQYTVGWAALRAGDPETAREQARVASRVVPEASVLLVASEPDADRRRALAEQARGHWAPVREQLATLVHSDADPPAQARDALGALDVPRGAWEAVGAASPAAMLWRRSHVVEREARRARRNPLIAALAEEAGDRIDAALGAEIFDLASRGIARIDAALERVDAAVTEADPRSIAHRPWSWEDFGW